MVILYLNVPKDKVDDQDKKSYEDTLNSALGSGYAMSMENALKCVPGSAVVLLCQATEQRAQSRIKALKLTGEKTGGGMVRYDVHMEDLTSVPYRPAPANFGRTGVLVETT